MPRRRVLLMVGVLMASAAAAAAAAAEPTIPTAPYPVERYIVLDAGFEPLWQAVDSVVSPPRRKVLLRSKPLGLFSYSEYFGPQLQEDSFRNLALFFAKLRQPVNDRSGRVAARLSPSTREALRVYDPHSYPSSPLIKLVLSDLNRLMFEEPIEGFLSPPGQTRSHATADSDDRAALNRLLLEMAYPDQILHSALLEQPRSKTTLVVSIYLHPVSATQTVLFAAGWLEGASIMSEQQHELFADVETALAKQVGLP